MDIKKVIDPERARILSLVKVVERKKKSVVEASLGLDPSDRKTAQYAKVIEDCLGGLSRKDVDVIAPGFHH